MSDMLLTLSGRPLGARALKALGLPTPVALARATGGYLADPFAGRTVQVGAAPGGRAEGALAAATGAPGGAGSERVDAVLYDGTGLAAPGDLRALYDFFHPLMPRIAPNARVLLVASEPDAQADPVAAAVARGVEGFMRSLGKELGKRGATANMAYLKPGAEDRLAGVVRFFAGVPSTYVSGQAFRVGTAVGRPASEPATAVLAGKVALVTGSARGIGAATAERLAEEGAHVVCLDVAAAREALEQTARRVEGTALTLDIAGPEAPRELAAFLRERFGGLDVLVHNAGITRDRTLAKLSPEAWDAVLSVNLRAVSALDEALLGEGLLRDDGRIVCLSSISGVAGNFGQTNYATSKAALIGYVSALAPRVAARGICVNAVAPGFIETPMTAHMPWMVREAGRRLNALSQGGQPRDVAELVTFLASPGASGLTGNTIRACGLAMLGA